MGNKLLVCSAIIFIALGSITISGCGKNAMGPTAPEVVNQPAAVAAPPAMTAEPAPDENAETEAACVRHPSKINKGKNFKRYIWNWRSHVPSFMLKFYAHVLCGWYGRLSTFPHPLKHLVSNKLFMALMIKFGEDRVIMEKVLAVLALGWAPGDGTNPGNFEVESTLLPKEWNPGRGFYGELKPGWFTHVNSVVGYEFYSTNAEGVKLQVVSGSTPGNIYDNASDVRMFEWIFSYLEPAPNWRVAGINMKLDNRMSDRLSFEGSIFELDSTEISINIYMNKNDKAAFFSVENIGTGDFKLQLTFLADGSGTGFVKVKNSCGEIDTYNYTIDPHGRGYYTKNGGHKHYFHL